MIPRLLALALHDEEAASDAATALGAMGQGVVAFPGLVSKLIASIQGEDAEVRDRACSAFQDVAESLRLLSNSVGGYRIARVAELSQG